MNWTTVSMSQSKLDDKQFDLVNCKYKGRWKTYKSYEVCNNFFKDSQKIYLEDGSTTVWSEAFFCCLSCMVYICVCAVECCLFVV